MRYVGSGGPWIQWQGSRNEGSELSCSRGDVGSYCSSLNFGVTKTAKAQRDSVVWNRTERSDGSILHTNFASLHSFSLLHDKQRETVSCTMKLL